VRPPAENPAQAKLEWAPSFWECVIVRAYWKSGPQVPPFCVGPSTALKLFAETVFVAVPVARMPAHASVIEFPETVFPLASLPPNVEWK
jgi:hypothetical protein